MDVFCENLKVLLSENNTTITALEREIGASTGVLRKAITKGTTISHKWVTAILSAYPNYSAEWLLMGKGDKFHKRETSTEEKKTIKEKYSIVNKSKTEILRKEEQAIKLYPLEASANLNTIFCDDNTETGYIYIPNAPKCDAAIYVRGDSMTPIINSGDIVAYKNINSLDYLQYGQMYLVHFELDGDYFLVIKYIRKSDKQGYVRLESHNTFHQPQEIPLSAIRNIALIKLSIRQNTQF